MHRATLWTLAGGSIFSVFSVLYQLDAYRDGNPGSANQILSLLLLFLSPYAALGLLAALFGRRIVSSAIVLAGSALVVVWGMYWHLDILFLRPSAMSQILSPLLIVGNQWLAVLVTGSLAVATHLIENLRRVRCRPPSRSSQTERQSP